MDLGLSEEQEMLKNFARDFLEKESPEKLVREMEEDERGYTDALWQGMAQQGWQGLMIPEEHGGNGMDFLDLCVLLEEFGRALVPGAVHQHRRAGGDPRAARRQRRAEERNPDQGRRRRAGHDARLHGALRALRRGGGGTHRRGQGDGYVLNGTKLFIPDAHVADMLVVVARTGGSGEDGITLFLVDGKASGVTSTVLKTIASDKQCEVKFENVEVGADAVLGEVGNGWETMRSCNAGPRSPIAPTWWGCPSATSRSAWITPRSASSSAGRSARSRPSSTSGRHGSRTSTARASSCTAPPGP